MSASPIDVLDVVSAFGAAWTNHDLEAALNMLTEDCVFDNTDPAPDGERFVGREAIGRAWSPIFEDSSARFDTEETFYVGDRVVQLWRYTWADGHVRGVDVFRIRDGKIAEKLSYVKG
jgi:ketosteroid isomerase-like protein